MFEGITSWENIYRAYALASRGKRSRPDIADFEYRLEDSLSELRAELISGEYRPGCYNKFYIHEPKKRLISAAPFKDRVVHHALCNIIQPVFEKSFVTESYANQEGKGNHRAIAAARKYARRFKYVLQIDVRQFFPSIDHEILHSKLARKITDQRVVGLIQEILASGVSEQGEQYHMVYFDGDDLFAVNRARGLPIGNLTSQLWANIYLNAIDHFIKRELQCKGYVRYVDDLLLFADDKDLMWRWKNRVVASLEKLRLQIHGGAHPRPVTEGFPFLGFTIFPMRMRIKRRKGIRFQRHLKCALIKYSNAQIDKDKLADKIIAWNNHASYGNTLGLRKKLFLKIPKKLKHCVLKD